MTNHDFWIKMIALKLQVKESNCIIISAVKHNKTYHKALKEASRYLRLNGKE
mgnify:FL=1